MGMSPLGKGLGVKIHPTMVATGKTGNRIHPSLLQSRNKLLGIEVTTDSFDMLAGVEVKMNLPKT